MTTTLLEALKSIKETLHAPDAWTRNSYAKDAAGNEVDVTDPSATSFCLMGAVTRADVEISAYSLGVTTAIQRAIYDLYTGYSTIAMFNDSAEITHPDVLKVIDLAIDAAS